MVAVEVPVGSLMWKGRYRTVHCRMGMCRRQIQGWDSALCSMVQVGARWLRSGQNKEVKTMVTDSDSFCSCGT